MWQHALTFYTITGFFVRFLKITMLTLKYGLFTQNMPSWAGAAEPTESIQLRFDQT